MPDPPPTPVEAMSADEASYNDQPPTSDGPVLPEAPSTETNYLRQPPLPPRPQRERRSDRQAQQPAGFAAWLLVMWEKLSEVVSGVIREIASGASPFGALLSGFYRMIAQFNG